MLFKEDTIMKKLLSILCAMVVLMGCAAAETVHVTIADDQGDIALAHEQIDVTDIDADGVVSICDALYAAHEKHYEGGAEAGFIAENTEYGISMFRLWGVENGGSYGYYVNNASPASLLDAVKDGDSIYAYAFTDLETWSDTYCYFDFAAIETSADFALKLTALTYDANWNMVAVPIAGAMITLNGEDSGIMTDADGEAVLDLESGDYLISAYSNEMNLVPPVCVAAIG